MTGNCKKFNADERPDANSSRASEAAPLSLLDVKRREETHVIGENEYRLHHWGSGAPVLLYPSLGRGAVDFDELCLALSQVGFHAIAIDPPGVATSIGEAPWRTLFDVASDLWSIVDELALDTPALIGHAYGNRVVRAASTLRPDALRALVLLACGGDVRSSEDVHVEFLRCFDPSIPRDEHLASVKKAFFAPSNDADPWKEGWHHELAVAQGRAVVATDFRDFANGGTAPCLIIQGLDDVIAPPQNAWNLVARRANTRVVGLENCGHAMLPEQPRVVAQDVSQFLREKLDP